MKHTPTVIKKHMHLILFALVAFVCSLSALNVIGLFDLDEGLYATCSRQMLESGDFITPRVGDGLFFDKPPLTYWAQALCMKLFGFTPLAARLPSALAMVGTAGLLWWWSKRAGRAQVGWLAGIFTMSSLLCTVVARQAVMDSMLTFFLTMAIIGIIEAIRVNPRWYYVAAAAVGLAMMTKGLPGLVLPGLTLLALVAFKRDWKELARVPWVGCLLLLFAIVLPWHIAVYLVNGQAFINEYIIHHHIQRFEGKDFGHNAPFWAYIPMLLVGMLPYIALAPRIWWSYMRKIFDKDNRSPVAIWALWATVVFLFYSISKSKLPGYIVPVIPALCLLVANHLVANWNSTGGLRKWEIGIIGFLGIFFGFVFFVAGIAGLLISMSPDSPLFGLKIPADVVPIASGMGLSALAIGACYVIGCLGTAMGATKVPSFTAKATLFCMLLTSVIVAIALPAWNKIDVEPLHSLVTIAKPELDSKSSKLVLLALEPRRPSCLYVAGNNAQVSETDLGSEAFPVMSKTKKSYVIMQKSTQTVPFQIKLWMTPEGELLTTPRDKAIELERLRLAGKWSLYCTK